MFIVCFGEIVDIGQSLLVSCIVLHYRHCHAPDQRFPTCIVHCLFRYNDRQELC